MIHEYFIRYHRDSICTICCVLFSLIVKHRLQKDVNNDIYSSVDCVIYDEHNDWFNNLNCIRLIFEGLINVSKAGINFVLEIYKIKMALRSF